MDSREQSACSNCGEDGAAFFLVTIVMGEKKSQRLCKKCYEQFQAGSPIHQALRQAKCRFCGGQAVATSMFPAGGTGALPHFDFVCRSCLEESQRLFLAKLDEWGMTLDGFPDPGEANQIQQLIEDIDAQMRRWVIQRDN
ncbi:hypothetical protein [Luteolibacter soli]|uniref:ClpX-type ZB domain-containing protein n=1 Tax=Luteolibacter soli TaxID=3135280 RepID=A0ABU9AMM7_9BACT